MKTSDKVKLILNEYPETRNSDQVLIAMIWWKFNQSKLLINEKESYIKLKDVKTLEKPASIIRCRQKFQEEGLFLAKEEVRDQRQSYAEEMKQGMVTPYWELNKFLT